MDVSPDQLTPTYSSIQQRKNTIPSVFSPLTPISDQTGRCSSTSFLSMRASRLSQDSFRTPSAFSAIDSNEESSSESENEDSSLQEPSSQKPASPDVLILVDQIKNASVMDTSSENAPRSENTPRQKTSRRAIKKAELTVVKRKHRDETTPSPTEINNREITAKRRPTASSPNTIINKPRTF